MAYKFKNYSGKHKFTGNFIYNSETYEYSLYLPAFDEDTKNEVINYFGDRRQNGRICLDVDKKVVEEYIDHGDISAYIIVNKSGSDDKASGTLQVYDHCSGNSQTLDNAYVWISDLCRITGPSGVKTESVNALMYFMEQLTVQNLGKTDIHLFVDTTDAANKAGLMRLYRDRYGFIENSEVDASICPVNTAGPNLIAMKKPNLSPDKSKIDFQFLRKRKGGSKRQTIKTKKKTKSAAFQPLIIRHS